MLGSENRVKPEHERRVHAVFLTREEITVALIVLRESTLESGARETAIAALARTLEELS